MIKLTKLKHKILVGSLIIFIFGMAGFISILSSNKTVSTDFSQVNMKRINSSASGLNQSEINDLLDGRLAKYNLYGHFEEYYVPSIRDTYFALYILDAIGKLNQTDKVAISNYIMNHYNAINNEFQDDYSLRFFDLDNSEAYYQNSPLLTYCYAVLSLILLDQLDSLVPADIMNYIWNCFDSNSGGFFGFPTPDKSPQNITTAENTFFAVIVLNELSIDWDLYVIQKTQIISFLNLLQIQSPYNPFTHGGFNNDLEDTVDTVLRYDPNLRSAFFTINTLNSLNMLSAINIDNFLQYIGGLYNSDSGCFYYNYFFRNGSQISYNIFSTGLGMELADLVGYNYDDILSLNFLLNIRMSGGGWENTQYLGNYELIDTYEVIRYFKRNNKLSYIDNLTKEEIYHFILRFHQFNGFSSLSKDHTSLKVISNTIKSFKLNNRIWDLNPYIQDLYDVIESAHKYYEFGDLGEGTWYGPVATNLSSVNYRTAPLEYKGTRSHNYSQNIGFLHSAEQIFYALSALDDIFKLDDFSSANNLTELLEHLVDCQFLETGYERYGGFIPDYQFTIYPPENYENYIYLRYAYFTIRSIEILDTFLDDGDITDNGINTTALVSFISKQIRETEQYLYYEPYYSSEIGDNIENAYFMVYILKTLDLYSLETDKIMNYIINNIDYSNFRDIYNLFKLSKLLNYSVKYNLDAVRTLIRDLYINEDQEFLESYNSETFDTDVLYWICDIAANDEIRLNYNIEDPIGLGNYFSINAIICNLILDDFGSTANLKFESEDLGVFELEHQEGIFSKEIYLPLNPMFISGIVGYLNVYIGLEKVLEVPVSLETYIDIITKHSYHNLSSDAIKVQFNYTIKTSFGSEILENSTMYVNIFLNDSLKESGNSQYYFIDNTAYHEFLYNFSDGGVYTLEFYIRHPYLNPAIYSPTIGKKELTLLINHLNVSVIDDTDDNEDNDNEDPNLPDSPDDSSNFNLLINNIPTISGIFGFAIVLTVSSTMIKRKHKKDKIIEKKNKMKIKKNNKSEDNKDLKL